MVTCEIAKRNGGLLTLLNQGRDSTRLANKFDQWRDAASLRNSRSVDLGVVCHATQHAHSVLFRFDGAAFEELNKRCNATFFHDG